MARTVLGALLASSAMMVSSPTLAQTQQSPGASLPPQGVTTGTLGQATTGDGSATTAPVASPATAATATPPAQDGAAPTDDTTADIVVTAQRRSENAQRTSLAVTALSGNTLAQRGVRDIQDLQQVSPSLTVSDAGLIKFANIRGVGNNLQAAANTPGVATYRDGLFAPGGIFLNQGVFDIASVEILRGPQGTFVGQNSTGGAIIQKSVSPELGATNGTFDANFGNYDLYKIDGAVTLPVGDTVAVRLAAGSEHRDSFYDNLGPAGDRPGRVREVHGRLGVLWKPTDSFSALLKSEIVRGRNGGYPQQPIAGTTYAAGDPPGDFTVAYDRRDLKRDEFSWRTSLELNYEFDGGTVLRSISGYQYGKQHFIVDEDATAQNLSYSDQRIAERAWSTEINLISPDTGRFKWVVGGTYVHDVAPSDLHFYFEGPPFGGTPFPRQDVHVDLTNKKESAGAFAQGSYKLTDRLTIELGGRYSYDRGTQQGGIFLLPNPPLPGFLDASQPVYDDNQLTGKASLNWQVDRDNLIYGFVANGFKSGGVNAPVGTFKPEKIVDYEAGWKSTLLGGRVTTQLNGFYMDYRDLQINIFNTLSTTTAIANAGKSTIYGVEAQAQARLGGLRADASLSYVHSKVGAVSLVDTRALPGGTANGLGPQCPAGTRPTAGSCFDYGPFTRNLDGSRNPYSPRWTISGGAEYQFALDGDRNLIPRVDVSYIGSQTTNLFATPVIDTLPSRVLVNPSVALELARLRVTAYASNVFDRHYRIGNTGINTFYGAPRQYGVRIGYRF